MEQRGMSDRYVAEILYRHSEDSGTGTHFFFPWLLTLCNSIQASDRLQTVHTHEDVLESPGSHFGICIPSEVLRNVECSVGCWLTFKFLLNGSQMGIYIVCGWYKKPSNYRLGEHGQLLRCSALKAAAEIMSQCNNTSGMFIGLFWFPQKEKQHDCWHQWIYLLLKNGLLCVVTILSQLKNVFTF